MRGRNLSVDTIALIERLFAEGKDQAAIATAAGVCLRTVYRVLRGAHVRQRRAAAQRDANPEPTPCPVQRCPGCGGLIDELPCRLCLVADPRQSLASGRSGNRGSRGPRGGRPMPKAER